MGLTRAEFQEKIKGASVLAPLTRGGNLPFRRLCTDFGVDITFSEMAYARQVVKGEGRELALLRRHPSEKIFGVQFAALQPEEALKAAQIAVERGADFVDINCGCPIEDVVRRGLGAALLRRSNTLFRLVEHLVKNLEIPVTVKIRLGWSESSINAFEIARGVENAGAAALTVHGRTREQRYSRAADWKMIGEIREKISIPLIGNGDILTWFEGEQRQAISGSMGLMVGRGALVKPWVFQEMKERRTLPMDAVERIKVYFKFAQYMKDHFRDDEKGLKRIAYFLPWHFSFFSRHVELPEEILRTHAIEHPLIQSRLLELKAGNSLDQLLSSNNEDHHKKIAGILLSSESAEQATERLELASTTSVLNPAEACHEQIFSEVQG